MIKAAPNLPIDDVELTPLLVLESFIFDSDFRSESLSKSYRNKNAGGVMQQEALTIQFMINIGTSWDLIPAFKKGNRKGPFQGDILIL